MSMARTIWLALALLVCACSGSHRGDRRAYLVAAEAGDVVGVRAQLEQGVGVDDVFNVNDPNALYLAAINGKKEVVRVLLEAGADPKFEYKGSSLRTEIQSFRARLKDIKADPDSSGTYRKQDGTTVDMRTLPLDEQDYDAILKMIEDAARKKG
jgi:ankyrin repeat protein